MKYPHRQKFTLADVADWDGLDLPGLVPKRYGKKYLNSCEMRDPKVAEQNSPTQEEKVKSA